MSPIAFFLAFVLFFSPNILPLLPLPLFSKGKTDIFGVECSDLVNLTKIQIGHDNAGIGSGWFLDKVCYEGEEGRGRLGA
jgi:hypothetical protein